MKIKLIFISLIFIFSLYQGAAMAATGDVIDSLNFSSSICAGYASAVQVDVDGLYNGDIYGNNETMVIFWTIAGVASRVDEAPPSGNWYFFSPDDTNCGGTAPWDRARVLVRFVDMLATDPLFDPTDPDTWVYKGIEIVSIKTWYDQNDPCVATAMPPSVQAYGDLSQSVPIVGTSTSVIEGEGEEQKQWEKRDFSDQGGIMELDVSSDFCNNDLNDLILDDAPISYPPHSCDTADYWVIGVFELLNTIDKWVEGGNCGDLTVGVFDVLNLVDFWVFIIRIMDKFY
jgi:hypothetical protein